MMLASIFATLGPSDAIDEDYLRGIFLNSLRHNRKKFTEEFGEVVICADGRYSWRKKEFAYYKANRKESRDNSGLDWTELFRIMTVIREELLEYFPYKVIYLETAEADDSIGVICHEYGVQLGSGKENILILSGDKDYIQLHKYSNIKQFNPVLKLWVTNNDPDKYLIEHILKGDSGDGIPNILSPDNCLVIGERQKSMTEKRLEEYSKGTSTMDKAMLSKYERNKLLIDLSMIPEDLKENILAEYNKENTNGRSKLFNFFIKKKLKNLLPYIHDF